MNFFASSLFPIGSLCKLLIPIGPFNPNVFFKITKRPFQDRRESVKFCLQPLNIACFFIEIYWSVGETI